MSLHEFSEWLGATSASAQIRDTVWVIPAVQCVHILAICVVFVAALILGLRLWGVAGRETPVSSYVRRYLPAAAVAIFILLLSGSILIVGEPERTLENWVFWTKMTLVAVGFILILLLLVPSGRDRGYWDAANRLLRARLLGTAALLIWIAVIVCGRWIAYVL